MYTPYSDTVKPVPMNKRLWDASIGNWYMGSLVLPTGKVATMNMNMIQVGACGGREELYPSVGGTAKIGRITVCGCRSPVALRQPHNSADA
jgi:hypothetical protein